jgi:hypothetical protein
MSVLENKDDLKTTLEIKEARRLIYVNMLFDRIKELEEEIKELKSTPEYIYECKLREAK